MFAQADGFLSPNDAAALNLISVSVAMLIAVWPALVAFRKGRSFWAWWLMSTLLMIVFLPLAFIVKPKPCPADSVSEA
jgi:hypothetical protein